MSVVVAGRAALLARGRDTDAMLAGRGDHRARAAYCRRLCPVRPSAAAAGNGGDRPTADGDACQIGARYYVSLRKPLGLVLEERGGNIIVAEIKPDSAAAKTGKVSTGDLLLATSAVVYDSVREYGGINVKGSQRFVRLLCRGESFNTVMAAIGSIPGNFEVDLEFCKLEAKRQMDLGLDDSRPD